MVAQKQRVGGGKNKENIDSTKSTYSRGNKGLQEMYLQRSLKFHELKQQYLARFIVHLAVKHKLKEFVKSANPCLDLDEDDASVGDNHTHAEFYSEWDPSDPEHEN